jgi:hypothetical protein
MGCKQEEGRVDQHAVVPEGRIPQLRSPEHELQSELRPQTTSGCGTRACLCFIRAPSRIQSCRLPLPVSHTLLLHSADRAGTFDKFKASSWGKKLARQQAKAAMNDFDRFKATATKVKKARVVRKVFNQLKKASQKK